jgi:hypothetical protein
MGSAAHVAAVCVLCPASGPWVMCLGTGTSMTLPHPFDTYGDSLIQTVYP